MGKLGLGKKLPVLGKKWKIGGKKIYLNDPQPMLSYPLLEEGGLSHVAAAHWPRYCSGCPDTVALVWVLAL